MGEYKYFGPNRKKMLKYRKPKVVILIIREEKKK